MHIKFDVINCTAMECPICLDDECDQKKMIFMPQCNHPVHTKCFFDYLSHNANTGCGNISCPICRSLVVNIPVAATQPLIHNRAMEFFVQEPHVTETAPEVNVNRAYLLGFISTMTIVWCLYILSQLSWHR